MTDPSPTVPRRRLGHELLRLRKAVGLRGDEVATMMEWSSPSKLYKIESGRQGIQPKELRELLGYYGVTATEVVDSLVDLARRGKQRAWWTPYSSAVDDSYTTYMGFESAASELKIYEPTTIVGLLQTEAYTRALLDLDTRMPEPALTPEGVESMVKLRMRRQTRLAGENPLHLWVIFDEAAVRRRIGDETVMAEQYEHLLKAARLPSVTVQVLPLREVASAAPPTNFTVVEFPDKQDRDVVYVELLTGGIFVEGNDVRWYNVAYNNLRAAALSPTKSAQLIKSIAAG
jgi:transcriptional regulator with XRE-family HTH domain